MTTMLIIAIVKNMAVLRGGCHSLLHAEIHSKRYVTSSWQLFAIMLLQYITVL